MTIQIVTYVTTDPLAPAHMRCAAAMVSDGRPGSHWMATGATETEARGKLETMLLPPGKRPKAKKGVHTVDDLV